TTSAGRVVDVTAGAAFLSGTHDGITGAAAFVGAFAGPGSHDGPAGGFAAAEATAVAQVDCFEALTTASRSLATLGIGSIVVTMRRMPANGCGATAQVIAARTASSALAEISTSRLASAARLESVWSVPPNSASRLASSDSSGASDLSTAIQCV